MIKIFCDICGKEINCNQTNDINIKPSYSSIYYEHSYTLCDECLKSIEKFIQGKTNG